MVNIVPIVRHLVRALQYIQYSISQTLFQSGLKGLEIRQEETLSNQSCRLNRVLQSLDPSPHPTYITQEVLIKQDRGSALSLYLMLPTLFCLVFTGMRPLPPSLTSTARMHIHLQPLRIAMSLLTRPVRPLQRASPSPIKMCLSAARRRAPCPSL